MKSESFSERGDHGVELEEDEKRRKNRGTKKPKKLKTLFPSSAFLLRRELPWDGVRGLPESWQRFERVREISTPFPSLPLDARCFLPSNLNRGEDSANLSTRQLQQQAQDMNERPLGALVGDWQTTERAGNDNAVSCYRYNDTD